MFEGTISVLEAHIYRARQSMINCFVAADFVSRCDNRVRY